MLGTNIFYRRNVIPVIKKELSEEIKNKNTLQEEKENQIEKLKSQLSVITAEHSEIKKQFC